MKIVYDLSVTSCGLRGGFSPAALFADGEAGAWYDPADMATLYQDSAGTTPVTAVGQPVGRMLDKSGNGNHAVQATAAARPYYVRIPATGARNLLTYSQSDTGFSPGGTTPPVVTSGATYLGQSCTAIAFDATMTQGASGCRATRNPEVAVTSGATYTGSYYLSLSRALTGSEAITVYFAASSTLGRVDLTAANSGPLVGSFVRMAGLDETVSTTGVVWLRVYLAGAVSSPVTLYLNRAQFEAGSVTTAYQATQTLYDITEEGVPSLTGLCFDGVDDFLSVASLDMTMSDAATAVAGVRKLDSGVARVTVGHVTSGVSPGGFELTTATGSNSNVSVRGRSTAGSTGQAGVSENLTAPASYVHTAQADYAAAAGAEFSMRLDGVTYAQSFGLTEDNTGTFGNGPLHLGSRVDGSLFHYGHIFGMVFVADVLAAPEIARAEAWMAAKTGVTL